MKQLTLALLLMLTTAAFGQEQAHEHDSPYAGMETRGIKALSDADIEGLLSGAGMGYAMAAELNAFPGPKHVLELADELQLTDEQREQTGSLFAGMQEQAIVLGKRLIELETRLDQAFASGEIDPERVQALTAAIGATEGQLRAVHLLTHLSMTPILTPHQQHRYQQLRGYDKTEGGHEEMDHGSMNHHP